MITAIVSCVGNGDAVGGIGVNVDAGVGVEVTAGTGVSVGAGAATDAQEARIMARSAIIVVVFMFLLNRFRK